MHSNLLKCWKNWIFLFKSPKKQTDISLNLKHNEKRLCKTKSMKYLGKKLIGTLFGNNRLLM